MKLRVVRPCPDPDPRPMHRGRRHCVTCDKTVVDLSRVTRKQAQSVIERVKRGEDVCARLRIGPHGNAVFRPEPRQTWAPGLILASSLVAGGCGDQTSTAFEPSTVAAAPSEWLDAGPPMLPIQNQPPPLAPLAPPAPAIESPPVPTAEQRALTRRKHRPVPSSVPHYPVDGGIGAF